MNKLHRHPVVISSTALFAILILLTTPVLGQARFDTLDISISALSASGTVLVGTDLGEVVIWSSSKGRRQIATDAIPLAISSDGSVVGGYFITGIGSTEDGFLWTQEDGVRPMRAVFGSVPGTYKLNDQRVIGLSEDGSTVVGSAQYDTGQPFGYRAQEAYRWSRVGGFESLGPSDNNDEACDLSGATAVSGDGSVTVGWRNIDGCLVEAMRWTGSSVQGLGFLEGGWESRATAVSADGSAIVGWNWRSQDNREAFRWTSLGGMEGLGFLDGGWAYSHARDISGDGSVVVGEASSDDAVVAFIWTAEEGMRRLQDVLEEEYEADLQGWTLTSAEAVSDDGRTITGRGLSASGFNGTYRVVLCGSDRFWANVSGGTFADAGNWALNAVPDSMSDARFATGGTYTVSFDDAAESNRLEAFGGTAVTLDLAGHTWVLKAGCTAPSVQIESAYLDVGNGTIEAVESVVLSGEDPVMNVDSGSRLVIDSDEDGSGCLVADGESGEALVSVSGDIESKTCSTLGGSAATAGRLVVDTGGRFTTDTLTVGGEGTGAIEIAQGHVGVDVLQMALEESSTATSTTENLGSLRFQTLADVGVRGKADLHLSNAGIIVGGDEGEVSLLVLGREQNGQGQLIIEDHSYFENSDAVVGQEGIGTIQLQSGGTATIRRIWIGGHLEGTEGVGGVYVDGAGSRLTARRIWIGRGGLGELKVSNGGRLEAGRIEVYGYGNTETKGGTIDAPVLYVGSGGGGGKTRTVDQPGVAADTLVLSGDGVTLKADTTVLGPDGVLDFTLDDANEGMSLTGVIALGGTLRIVRSPTHTPEVGQEYPLLTSASAQGVFDRIVTAKDMDVEISYSSTAVMVTVTAVSVSSDRVPSVTSHFILHEPYPNPFDRSTRISFEIPETGYVRLTGYDILGREVSQLIDGHLTTGSHEVEFEAGHLPNGVYLLRLETGGGLQSRKVVLAR